MKSAFVVAVVTTCLLATWHSAVATLAPARLDQDLSCNVDSCRSQRSLLREALVVLDNFNIDLGLVSTIQHEQD